MLAPVIDLFVFMASASALFVLPADNLFSTSDNGNDYNLTAYGDPDWGAPIAGDDVFLGLNITFATPIVNVSIGAYFAKASFLTFFLADHILQP